MSMAEAPAAAPSRPGSVHRGLPRAAHHGVPDLVPVASTAWLGDVVGHDEDGVAGRAR